MVLSISQLHSTLYDLFHSTADQIAQQTGFCRRKRHLTGAIFAQSVVFSLLAKPHSTLEDYADFAADQLDVFVTHKAFEERFTQAASQLMQHLFLQAFGQSFAHLKTTLLPLLRRFQGVYLRDATFLPLPPALADCYPARKSPQGKPQAAIKMVLEMELITGEYTGVSFLAGIDNEKTAEVASRPLPPGALLLEDMGFLSAERLQDHVDQGVYFLTRVPAWTAFFEHRERGKGFQRVDLLQWLRSIEGSHAQRAIFVFHKEKLALRLLAVRVPEAVAQQRRQRVIQEAKKRGRPVSQKKLELCSWNILVTNAPEELISLENAWSLRRVRWQIELVFKVFKSEGGLKRTQARNRWRILTEVYGKLLAMMVQHWCLLASGYQVLRHSERRASGQVRRRAGALVRSLANPKQFRRQINELARRRSRCKIQRRHKNPSGLDLLLAVDPEIQVLEKKM